MRYYPLISIILSIALFQPPNEFRDSASGQLRNSSNENAFSGYTWTEHTSNSSFPKSYNFQMVNIRDTMWVFHSAGNWYSVNGKDWIKSGLYNSINNLGFLDYVFFNNAVYGLGHFEGNIERHTLTTEIYKSTDLKTWTILSKESNLPKRFFYHPFVFQNKIWIIGGSDEHQQYADAWNSEDGVNWTKVADNLPFGKRDNSQFVLFNDKIYMMNNDVWSSPDGITWKRETSEIAKGENIFGYSSIVFDNKIWLLGCNRNGLFTSEILASTDGKTWIPQSAPWTPRGGIASCVYQGKIFMTGGKYGGTPGKPDFVYSNDVWSLEKFESEETNHCSTGLTL